MKKSCILILLIVMITSSLRATIYTINVSNYVYTPNALSVSCGDTVRFHWITGTHPTVSETGTWVTFTLSAAMVNKDIVFATAGTYPYYCDFHGGAGGVGMAGSITVTCAPPTCAKPTGVTASMITSTSARISWTAVAGATKYQVQYRPSGVVTWSKANTTGTFKNLAGLTPATTYQYRVKTICGATNSGFTTIQTFTTLAFTDDAGNQKTTADTEVHMTMMGVYPNPNNGTFQVVMEHVHQDDVVIQVYDLMGKLLIEKPATVSGMGVIEDITLPAGFKGTAIVKVNVLGKDYTKDIFIQ